MQTVFIHTTLERPSCPEGLDHLIEEYLRQQGVPLRWAVTAVSGQTMTIEAVLLKTGGGT
ncbi:hypothetical protein RYO59_002107 [Thermosynechococcaceae cyanobacterium Okahandja]